MKGVKSGLEKKSEKVGEKVGSWIADRIGNLFRKEEEKPNEEDELNKDINEAALSAKNKNKAQLNSAIKESKENLVSLLKKQGISDSRAIIIAEAVRKVAESSIEKNE